MTLVTVTLLAMIVLRVVVLWLMMTGREDQVLPDYLPPVEDWRGLIPFIAGEIPVFAGLLFWLRTGSTWAIWVTAALATLGVVQGLITLRKGGPTLLHIDAALALVLIVSLALLVTRTST